MLKILFSIFLLFSSLSANKLFDKIENFIGKKQFKLHNNLIQNLFKKQDNFYIGDDKLDYSLLLFTLKEHGLLNLKFKKPQEMKIEFLTNADALKSLKILNDTLRAMGYYYYFTSSAKYDKSLDTLIWTIVFHSEYALDPFLLIKELKTQSCNIKSIIKIKNDFWKYSIDVKNAKIRESIKIDKNERVVLQKPLRPYFLEVKDVTSLQVIGRKLNHWFPYIVFYDKHLNILKVIKKKRTYKGYKTKIPSGTQYIKVTDLYTLINIKRGLSIIVK